jgi:hypothetical protein
VAGDARRGATVISENPLFFFYLNYQLGLEAENHSSPEVYLGQSVYQSHGYEILQPDDTQRPDDSLHYADSLRDKVVIVKGPGSLHRLQWTDALDARLSQRCRVLGKYRDALDPSYLLKRDYTTNVPTLAYRVNVIWFDCP